MKGTVVELPVTSRKTGKHHSRTLRKQEQVPGVLYGNKKENFQVAASEKLIKRFSTAAFENTIFTLKSDNKAVDGTPVLLKAIDLNPVNRRPLHFDAYIVDMNKTVRVYVELRFEGKAIGLSEGGVLQPIMRELEVECLPKDIPSFIAVDVSNLGVHQTAHISEITLPEGVKAVATEDLALVTVTVIEEEAAPTPGAEVAAAAPTEPEVIKKGKKDEEGAAPAAGGAAAPAAGGAAKK